MCVWENQMKKTSMPVTNQSWRLAAQVECSKFNSSNSGVVNVYKCPTSDGI